MAEDGKVVYKIEGDNSQAMKALDEFEAAAKASGQRVEESVKKSVAETEKTVKKIAKEVEESSEKVKNSNEKAEKSGKKNQQQAEKTATAYEKLTQKIQDQESALNSAVSEYKNVILEQGLNSKSAQDLRAKIDSLNDELSESEERLSDVDDAADKATGSFNKTSNSIEKIAKAIGSAFVVKQAIEFGKAAVGVASDLNEVQNVVDTTFGTEGAIKINEWARNAAEAFGESELQAKQFTSTLGAMFKSMGVGQAATEEMSMSLAGLAGDMASFYNLDPAEAFEKLRSGISGETEPLKQLGINMSVVNLEALAMSMGIKKSYNEMTQAEQATLRYQYIMNATADAQGDFSHTSDSLANQQRILQLEIQTLAAEIGQDLMPAAQEILSIARDGIEWIRENKDALEGLTVAVGLAATGYATWKATLKAEELYDKAVAGIKGITAAISGAEAAGGLTSALSGADAAATGMGTTILGALGPAGWATVAAVAGIGAIIAIVYELQQAQEEALETQYDYMNGLTNLQDLTAAGYVSNSKNNDEAFAKYEADYKAGKFNAYLDSHGNVDWEKYVKDQGGFYDRNAGTWNNSRKNADGSVSYNAKTEPYTGGKRTSIKELASRHQSGEDFVMADWTPAYLDYGERVLTASENAKYTAMGGVDGMEQRMTSGGTGGGTSVPSRMELGLKVSPREMAHAITPYIIKELQAQGQWEDVR